MVCCICQAFEMRQCGEHDKDMKDLVRRTPNIKSTRSPFLGHSSLAHLVLALTNVETGQLHCRTMETGNRTYRVEAGACDI